MKVTAIICAAGRGERAERGRNKVFEPLYGAPVLWHTLRKFSPYADEIIVACSAGDREEAEKICAPFNALTVQGGETRTESVRRALEMATGDITVIHDGARPFVRGEKIAECIKTADMCGSAVCAVPSTDTLAHAENGSVAGYADRKKTYRVQTPQGFRTAEIKKAYEMAERDAVTFTDDSSAYFKYIGRPRIFEGDEDNAKLTYPGDFMSSEKTLFRDFDSAGFGEDVHVFAEGNGIRLCGVDIPCDRRLISHSDGDAAAHAVCDALLSCAGLRDIGYYFPDTDEKWRGADSMFILSETVRIMKENGYEPSGVSLSVQTERPRLSHYIDAMRGSLAEALGLPLEKVTVAAGTCEGLGFVGEGTGLAAYCAACAKKTGR